MQLAKKHDREVLIATLSAAGFDRDTRDIDCLAFSGPSIDGNKGVHLMANEQLLEVLVRDQAGHCYHVTGEMRALADPFHRRLCTELVKRAGSRFIVIYNIPERFRRTPEGVGRWNARSWGSKGWAEKLSAIRLIGEQVVDVRAYNTLEEVQYSVFGNRYVLLQEKHQDEGARAPIPKRVWLLRSSRLNEFLTAKAMRLAKIADDMPEALFRRFSARINGITSRIILTTLARDTNRTLTADAIDTELKGLGADDDRNLEALNAIGFIDGIQGGPLELTPGGRHYLSTVGLDHRRLR